MNVFPRLSRRVPPGVFSSVGATLEILRLSSAMLGVPYPIVVTSTGGSIDSSVFAKLTIDPSYPYAASYSVLYDTKNDLIDVTFSSVPKPGRVAFAAVGASLLPRRRRRQH